MKTRLVDILCCPQCGSSLRLVATSSEVLEDPAGGSFKEILEGTLSCSQCGKIFPITRGIPRFTSSDDYAKNFSIQWSKLRNSGKPPLLHSTESQFSKRTDFDVHRLRGKWVLEAGCGAGRFVRYLSDYGPEIVGVDISFGVDDAYGIAGRRSNVHLVQANLFELPFKDARFDCIYSLGVLHHTPNTKKAFARLPPLLKPGGRIAIWVYSHHNQVPWKAGDYWRKITTRLPPRFLFYLCHIAIPMHYVYKIPFLGRAAQIFLRTDGAHPDPRFRVLNTFDYYAPKYQFRHTYAEVFDWFEDHGLEKIRVLPAPVSMAGSCPIREEDSQLDDYQGEAPQVSIIRRERLSYTRSNS